MKERVRKIFILLSFFSVFFASPAFAEFDDDIVISIGSFSLDFGWFLDYRPSVLDKNEAIFPLLKFVEENYDELSKTKLSYLAWIEKSNDKKFPYKLGISDDAVKENKIRYFLLKNEEDSISVLIKIISESVFGDKKITLKDEPLSLYLVAKKVDRDSNVPCWYGELFRHSSVYRITDDDYIYSVYFSYDKAVKKILSEDTDGLKKLVFTKESIKNFRIDVNTKIEDILSNPSEGYKKVLDKVSAIVDDEFIQVPDNHQKYLFGDGMHNQLLEFSKVNLKNSKNEYDKKEWQAFYDIINVKNYALKNVIPLQNDKYFLNFQVRVIEDDDSMLPASSEYFGALKYSWYICMTYDFSTKKILKFTVKTNPYSTLNFHKCPFNDVDLIYSFSNDSSLGSWTSRMSLYIINPYNFKTLLYEEVLFHYINIECYKDFEFTNDSICFKGFEYDDEKDEYKKVYNKKYTVKKAK